LQAVPYTSSGGTLVAGVPFSLSFIMAPGGGLTVTQDSGGSNITITPPSTTSDNRIQIDDGPDFNTPIVDQTFSTSSLSISNITSSGLVPGITYNFKSLPSGTVATCVIQPTKWNFIIPQSDWLTEAWTGPGRSGLAYIGSMTYSGGWSLPSPDTMTQYLTSSSTAVNYQVATMAQMNEMILDDAVQEAQQHFDISRIDELAQYYYQYMNSTATLTLPGASSPTTFGARIALVSDLINIGTAEGFPTTQLSSSYLTTVWPSTTKTMATYTAGQIEECQLCNEIFLYSAAKLMRLITTVPSGSRTTNMTSFISAYKSFLVDDIILRYVYNYKVPLGTCATYMSGLADPTSNYNFWNYVTTNYSQRATNSLECYSMANNNLYLIGMAAEILGANANNSTLVPLTNSSPCSSLAACELTNLQNVVQAGVAFFKKKQNDHSSTTTNFQGQSATAISYFDGDFVVLGTTVLPDTAYSCFSSSSYPTTQCNLPGSPTNPVPLVSWDNSHYATVPLFLRSLFDNKKVINSLTGNFPAPSDLSAASNQLIYNVMQNHTQSSGQTKPVFANYMDGTDGWYRVGYNGTNSGYAPSSSCDARSTNPPALSTGPWTCVAAPGVTSNWGGLSAFSSDLNQIEQNFVALAQATDTTSQNFRDLHYYDPGRNLPFSFYDSSQNIIYATGMINILFGNSAYVQ
jgi:hypothetical protein